MVTGSSPTLLKRYIAFELRRLREDAQIKREQVADRLRCAVSHITHLEIARSLPKAAEVEVILKFYGSSERTAAFLELIDSARRGRDWWTGFSGSVPEWFDLYLAMESSATTIQSYDALVVPGLMQTPSYARAVIRAEQPSLDEAAVEHRVALRMARQDVLTRQPSPPTVWVVLDGSIFERVPADPAVLVEQVEYLAKLTDLPTCTLQILPMSAGLHAGVSGTFSVLTFGPELVGDPGVAYTESRIRGTYYEDSAEISRYRDAFTRVAVAASRPEETRATLAHIAEELTS